VKAKIREADILRGCLEYLQLRHDLGLFWRNNTTGVFDPKFGGFRQFNAIGTIKGVADILGVLRKDGRLFACEVKKPGGKLRPEQAVFLKEVNECGGIGIMVKSVDELTKECEAL